MANFCRDYIAAASAYQQTSGYVGDPSFAQFVSFLTKARAEAPAAVKSDVTSMLNDAKKVKAESATSQSVTGDVTAASSRVSDWGASHCSNNGTGSSNPAKRTTPTHIAPATTAPAPSGAPGNTGTSTGITVPVETTSQQLGSFDSILRLAETGRRSLANGDLTAAIANRRAVLQELGALHPDSELSASVRELQAAETYSLHADTTCGLSCSASVDAHSTQLKQAFLASFNPIATRYNTPTYKAGDI